MWFNLSDDDQKLIADLAAGVAQPEPAVELQALHSRITTWKLEQASLGAYRDAIETDDDLEVDSDAVVSIGGDPGAWVHGWIWVTNEQAGVEDPIEDAAKAAE